MSSVVEALRPFSRRFGLILLVGVVLGTVAGLAVSMLTYSKQTAIVYVQIGLAPHSTRSATLFEPVPLQGPNINPIETVPDTVARIASRSFGEKVAQQLGRPELGDALARGDLAIRPIPTMEGGLLELAYSSDEAGVALMVVRAAAQALAAEHQPLFVASSEPYRTRRAELSADLADSQRLLEQMEKAIQSETDTRLVPLLQVGRVAAAAAVEEASEAIETYARRMSVTGIQNTHLVGNAVLRRSILSVLAAAATIGALGGLAIAVLICAALYRRPTD